MFCVCVGGVQVESEFSRNRRKGKRFEGKSHSNAIRGGEERGKGGIGEGMGREREKKETFINIRCAVSFLWKKIG